MKVVDEFYPHWRELIIHESSPINRGASIKLQKECSNYISLCYYPGIASVIIHNRVYCEDLEHLSFPDESIDLHITQDAFEHLFNPEKAFFEIYRTLKYGGAHIFTVSIVRKQQPSICQASLLSDGPIAYHNKSQYRSTPFDSEGSLITFDVGYDIMTLMKRYLV